MKKATLGLLAKHLNPSSRIVVRADFNVPIKDGKVGDLNRVKSKILIMKAPYPPSMNYLNTIQNHLFSSPIWADLMDKRIPNTPSSQSYSLFKPYWVDLLPFWMTALEIMFITQSVNPLEVFSFAKTFDSIQKRKDPLKTKRGKRLKANLTLYKILEKNFLDWVMFMSMMPSEAHTELTLVLSESSINIELLVS